MRSRQLIWCLLAVSCSTSNDTPDASVITIPVSTDTAPLAPQPTEPPLVEPVVPIGDLPHERGKHHLFDPPDNAERVTPRRSWKKKAKLKKDAGATLTIGHSAAGLTASGSPTVFPVLDDSLPMLPGLQPGPYKLEQWVDRDVDCGIHRFGAKNNTVCDYAPAFERIFADVALHLGEVDFDWLGYGDHTGTKILVPAGLLWLSRTIRLCRAMYIDGVSGGQGGATNFYTPHGCGAFRIAYYDECVDLGEGEGGSDSILSNFNVLEATGLPANSTLVVGIQLDTMAELKNMYIYGYVQGIRISADVNRVPRTNANGWRIDHVRVTNSEHAGMYITGGDANIGLGLQPNVVSACTRGSYWVPTLGSCANQVYKDFLGSTVIASHASGSNDTTTHVNFNNYLAEGDSQRMFLGGAYSEGDDMLPVIAQNDIWIGNTAKDVIGGLRVQGPWFSGALFENGRDPTNIVWTALGDQAAPATMFEGRSGGTTIAQPIRLKLDTANHQLTIGFANTNAGILAKLAALTTSPQGLGALTLTLPLSMGSTPPIPMQVVTSTPAASLCTAATLGAVNWERAPTKTGCSYYQCTKTGTVLAWRCQNR